MPMRLPIAVAFLATQACLCSPNPKAPVTIMALLYDNANRLGPRQTELETLTQVAGLKGTVVNMVGGASIVVDQTDPLQQDLGNKSDTEIANALYRARGSEVHANLIDKSGVLWPADFHSWAMVTTYWNFEQSFNYFNRIYDGAPTDGIEGADLLYWGSYKNANISDPMKQDLVDNIIYYPPVRAFLVAPFKDLQKVPVSMNLGIVGHEFAHRVFTHKAYGNQALPAELNLQGAPLNIIRSLDEGLADFHGYGVTCIAKDGPGCSTKFLLASFDEATATRRDFSRSAENCMSADLKNALSLPSDTFAGQGQQYKLGTLIAASLYQAANKGGKVEIMQKALIRAYSDESNLTPGLRQVFQSNLGSPEKITLERIADVILSHITDPELKRLTCNELWDRLDLEIVDTTSVPACPNTSLRGTTCLDIP